MCNIENRQQDLDHICEWLKRNNLKLNWFKSAEIVRQQKETSSDTTTATARNSSCQILEGARRNHLQQICHWVSTSTMLSARVLVHYMPSNCCEHTACVPQIYIKSTGQSWSRNYCMHPLLGGVCLSSRVTTSGSTSMLRCMIRIVPITADCQSIDGQKCRWQTVWPCFIEWWPSTSWTVTRIHWHFLQSAISFSWQIDPREEGTFSRKELCHANAI